MKEYRKKAAKELNEVLSLPAEGTGEETAYRGTMIGVLTEATLMIATVADELDRLNENIEKGVSVSARTSYL